MRANRASQLTFGFMCMHIAVLFYLKEPWSFETVMWGTKRHRFAEAAMSATLCLSFANGAQHDQPLAARGTQRQSWKHKSPATRNHRWTFPPSTAYVQSQDIARCSFTMS